NGDVEVFLKIKFNVQHTLLQRGLPVAIPTAHEILRFDKDQYETVTRRLNIKYVMQDRTDLDNELYEGSVCVSRIYPKNKEQNLEKGEHVVEVLYVLEGAVSKLANGYEFYFPIISSHLPVPIKQVSAIVSLPQDAKLDQVEASGFLGSKSKQSGDVKFRKDY